MSLEHRLNVLGKVVESSDCLVEAAYGEEQCLFDTPVRVAASG